MLFPLFLQISSTVAQLLDPHFSCRSCNVVALYNIRDTGSDLSSSCSPFSCDSSTVGTLGGPTCVTPFGDTVTCNNTAVPAFRHGPIICNCNGPVTVTSTSFASQNMTLNPGAVSGFQPLTCTGTTPPSVAVPNTQQNTCNVTNALKVCSYYTANFSETSCLSLPYDPAHPNNPYSTYGVPYTCNGSPQRDATSSIPYTCRCDRNLQLNEIMPLYQQSYAGSPPTPFIFDCTYQNSHNVLVDMDNAFKLVQNDVIDLRPIIDLVSTE